VRGGVALCIPAPAFAAVLGALVLAGCAAAPPWRFAAPVPLPSRALLAAPRQPDCEYRRIGLGDTMLESDEDAARHKLEYERQCYRRAEMMMRARLRRLQASVAQTVKAVRRNEPVAW
jgi:hypothetical protein